MPSRLLVPAALAVLVSCESAPLPAPPPEDLGVGWTIADDWPRLPREEPLGRVLGVAVDARGRVWISHTGAAGGSPGILALDPDTGEVVGGIDASRFRSPHALAWDDQNRLWVTDDAENRVTVLDERGNVLWTIGADEP